MNPVVFEAGPLVVRTYAAWLASGILLALGLIIWRAYRHAPGAVTRWLDVGIAAVVGGVIGARAWHVVVEWHYFADHTDEIAKISQGGLAWHGALLVGIPVARGVARVRRVPFKAWTDAAALAWPVGLIAAWIACRRAGCAYGYEVRTLADWPDCMVEELPDIYGLVAPRLEVQIAGVLFSLGLLALALLLTWRGWLPGIRFWLALALTGLGFYFIGFFRDDPAQTLFNRRADQIFDLAVFFNGTMIGSAIWWWERLAATGTDDHMEATIDECHAGPSSDQSEAG